MMEKWYAQIAAAATCESVYTTGECAAEEKSLSNVTGQCVCCILTHWGNQTTYKLIHHGSKGMKIEKFL